MPTYEYACAKCGERFDVYQSFSDEPLKKHKGCGGKLTKVFGPVGIVLKGSGFYKTDNRSSSAVKAAKKDSEPASSESSSAAKSSDAASSTSSSDSSSKPSDSKPSETSKKTDSSKKTETKSPSAKSKSS